MKLAWLALLIAPPALGAQDKTPEDVRKLAGEAAQAFRQTAKAGSFEFTGTLKTEVNPDEAESEPTECKVSGATASPFQAVFKAKSDTSTHDLVFKSKKLAGRETWKGHPLDLGKGPSEVLSLLNFERLAIFAEKATGGKAAPDAKVAGADCRVLDLVLPKQTMRSYSEDAEAAEEEEKSVEKVELRIHVRKSDGLVVKIESTVHRLYKDEDNPADSSKGRSSYAFTLKEFGAAKVTIPAGLEKLIED